MKKLYYIPVAAMLATALFTSCRNEEAAENIKPVFPETVANDIVEPGETVTLTFNANMNWEATLSGEDAASYFAIVDGGFESQTIKGTAGDVLLNVKCTAKEADLNDHTAEVVLKMGGESKVIAEYTLASSKKRIDIILADRDESGFVPSTDGSKFKYSYTGEPIGENEDVELVWMTDEYMYEAYFLLDANVDYEFGDYPDGFDVEMIYSEKSRREYRISYSGYNFTGAPVDAALSLVSAGSDGFSYNIGLSVPVFSASFSLYLASFDEEAQDWELSDSESGSSLRYAYDFNTPVGNDKPIELLWPEGKTEYANYIVADSNFRALDEKNESETEDDDWRAYPLEKPDWLIISPVAPGASGAKKEYAFSVEPSAEEAILEGAESGLVFGIAGTDVGYSYKVKLPANKYMMKSGFAKDLKFNGKGEYIGTNGVSPSAIGSITAALEPEVFRLCRRGGWYYTEDSDVNWMKLGVVNGDTFTEGLEWSSETVLHTSDANIWVSENPGEAREGVILVIPATLVSEKGIASAEDILTDSGSAINEEYKEYVVAEISQEKHTEETIITADSDWWPEMGAEFRLLTGEDADDFTTVDNIVSSAGVSVSESKQYFRLTYTSNVEGVAGSSTFTFTVPENAGKKVIDTKGSEDPEWLHLNEWKYVDNSYYVTMDVTAGQKYEAIVLFTDPGDNIDPGDDSVIAAMLCRYDENAEIGGDTPDTGYKLEFAYPQFVGENATLTDISDTEEAEGHTMYELTYKSPDAHSLAQIKGIPMDFASFTMNPSSCEWLVEDSISFGEMTTIIPDYDKAFPDGNYTEVKTVKIIFYGQDLSPILTIKLNLDLRNYDA